MGWTSVLLWFFKVIKGHHPTVPPDDIYYGLRYPSFIKTGLPTLGQLLRKSNIAYQLIN